MQSGLTRELVIILVLKLIALFAIWYMFFADDSAAKINPLTTLLS